MDEDVKILWNSLSDVQKEKVEDLFQKKRTILFEWYEEETKKVDEKLKIEGRFRTGLDANNNCPEVRTLSQEYNSRFYALPKECIYEVIEHKLEEK